MKKIIFASLLLIAVVMVSCTKEKESGLEGIWMNAYVGMWENDSLRYENPGFGLVEFTNDSVHFKSFEHWRYGTEDEVKSYAYTFENNILYYDNDSIVFQKITGDSLVADVPHEYAQLSRVYKRIKEKSSPSIELTPDFYRLEVNNYIDSFQIVTDGMLLHDKTGSTYNGVRDHWYIGKYKDLSFLVISDNMYSPPLLLTETNDERTAFKMYELFEYTGAISTIEANQLDGDFQREWVQNGASDWNSFIPYLLPFDNFDHSDSIAKLSITEDSVFLEQYNIKRAFGYWISESQRHLLLGVPDSLAEYDYWYMSMNGDSSLSIETGLTGLKTALNHQIDFVLQ